MSAVAAARAAQRARAFLERHGPEFGLEWDGAADRLVTGPRAGSGESRCARENTSNYFKQGQTSGQPLDLDRYAWPDRVTARDTGAAPPASGYWDACIEAVGDALLQLDEPTIELLTLRYFDDRTLDDIATRLGVTYQAVQSRLKTALRRLERAVRGELERRRLPVPGGRD